MPLIATRGAASAQGFGEFAQATAVNYIEDVFSTYLYTGNSSTQTITNGIDLSGKGGMVWGKSRTAASSHNLYDTVRGASLRLAPNLTNAQANTSPAFSSFNSNGFSLNGASDLNNSGDSIVSWTFREQAKFFDVVTYTGNGATRTIAHNLGSTPGCIIVKRLDGISPWTTYHSAIGASQSLYLNSTDTAQADTFSWNSTAPTSSVFTVGSTDDVNRNTSTYVAYLFASNAGGFGLTGNNNVITCGSFTTGGSGNFSVDLGYEPQWVLAKATNEAGSDWYVWDTMRGWPARENTSLNYVTSRYLSPNTTGAEANFGGPYVSNTGFGGVLVSSITYIYIAIRRGPMKVPTLGTTVFTPATRTGDGTTSVVVTNATFPVDLAIGRGRSTSSPTPVWIDRLRGATRQLRSDNTDAEAASTIMSSLASQTGWIGSTGGSGSWNVSSVNYIQWYMRRAPGFFDEVCYTGNGLSTQTITHNLAVTPELVIAKSRNGTGSWYVYTPSMPAQNFIALILDDTTGTVLGTGGAAIWGLTSTTFNANYTAMDLNNSGIIFVAYLFATCPGVSKVGSYTGTGALQTVNCGFTSGARFVLIRRLQSGNDWYVYDSARGISSGNDPYLFLNGTAAEDTGTNYVDTTSVGFQVTAAAPAALNASGGTYIFLAIA